MTETVIVDAGFLLALIERGASHHRWAATMSERLAPPWQTCDAALSEAFHVAGKIGLAPLVTLLRSEALRSSFQANESMPEILGLMEKYAEVPMSFGDACLVRMTEVLPDPVLLTTNHDFRLYRRLGRRVVPTQLPADDS